MSSKQIISVNVTVLWQGIYRTIEIPYDLIKDKKVSFACYNPFMSKELEQDELYQTIKSYCSNYCKIRYGDNFEVPFISNEKKQ